MESNIAEEHTLTLASFVNAINTASHALSKPVANFSTWFGRSPQEDGVTEDLVFRLAEKLQVCFTSSLAVTYYFILARLHTGRI